MREKRAAVHATDTEKHPCEFTVNNTIAIEGLQSIGCQLPAAVPNAFLMSVLLFIGTFLISRYTTG